MSAFAPACHAVRSIKSENKRREKRSKSFAPRRFLFKQNKADSDSLVDAKL